MKKHIIFYIFLLLCTNLYSQDNTFPFLDIKAMGAYDFIKANPEYDGRGVVIFVLDNSVDPSIPGLINTSTGKPKVIDMQDFSNQLVFNLKEAEFEKYNNIEYFKAGDIRISGLNNLKYQAIDKKYYYAIIDENKHFKNSVVKDLNSNGKKDDKFVIIAFKIEITQDIYNNFKGLIKPKVCSEQWVYYVDENLNGAIDDEQARFNYKYNLDYFNFYSGEKGRRPVVVMSANISPDSKKMVINPCDGSHGTHCAGIASGYEIYNQKNYNGIAPGAYVVSLKIGSNLLSGGATTSSAMKKAYEYAIDFLKESGIKYGVFSMSYGIGSEEPGRSEIDKFLDNYVLENPNIVVVTSNGNSGPGINSTGNPSGANNIISVGAMLPVDVLKNLYGSLRNKPWITHFSSRGAECNKPDVIAPGGASSSVPNFETGDAFWGTSMACPQVAGAAAVLFSAAEQSNLKVNGAMIKKAIKYAAKPLDNYLNSDQGFGLVNIPNSYNLLKLLSERKEYEKAVDYTIETTNTFYPDKKGNVAFWKSGGYFPRSNEKQFVSVKPIFYDNLDAELKHNFYRAFNLSSDVNWLKTDKNEIYLRGELGAYFSLIYDESKLTKPGIYEGRIVAKPKGEEGSNYADFEVQANIVIPYKFTAENNYTQFIKQEKVEIGDIKRIFFETPVGASSVLIKISPVENKNFNLIAYLFNPDGNKIMMIPSTDEKLRKEIILNIDKDKLMHGTWELMGCSNYLALNDSYFDVKIQFFMFDSKPNIISKLNFTAGDKPSAEFKLMNFSENAISGQISGKISGYCSKSNVKHQGRSVYVKNIRIADDIAKCTFTVDMDNNEFNKTTDIAFNIFNENGESIVSDGFSRKTRQVTFYPPKAGNYRIELEAGFTDVEFENSPWIFDFEEQYYYKNPNYLKFDSYNFTLYPSVWNDIKFSTNSTLLVSPDGFNTFGEIDFIDNINKNTVFEQKILLK